jgi:hypothetical protein
MPLGKYPLSGVANVDGSRSRKYCACPIFPHSTSGGYPTVRIASPECKFEVA